ncbi:MAG TPA: DUF2797 domain-containing protein [Gammaproteobacteria bacterium]|nr:DUF2797 domain-containing protein [Gammaproteobacteria bacterium]
MTRYSGHLSKLSIKYQKHCSYFLHLDDETSICLNDWIGQEVTIHFSGIIHCVYCGAKTKKSYSQGYCYIHSQRLARCDLCILKPELCHFHQGTCREPQWGKDHCMQPHYIYLANSTGLKVGITRAHNLPQRWLDQGAIQAIPIIKVNSRLQSGLIEVAIAKHIADKTNWRQLIREDSPSMDLIARARELLDQAKEDISTVVERFPDDVEFLPLDKVDEFKYPVDSYPDKIKSLGLDKSPMISGKLLGIKGQYLLFSQGAFNVRKHTGYWVDMSA